MLLNIPFQVVSIKNVVIGSSPFFDLNIVGECCLSLAGKIVLFYVKQL